ncbi:cation diffusion facilitator family transporter [Legionella micdadei]|uniref:Cation efflux system protein n=1 Tax=Legionella micdadei TaxID=451 RepID=A0A098GKP7_LEGMI|nr:cation diffusion facilitator family transporter [Legionella micdadei]ARG96539.1 cation transporter [Legionella micdadei]ARG99288.1 cation transporter [Legionella micdadei]KTD27391.1 cation efflux system protein [Legionella micdadei]NSL18820.1 cation transporter [Legionella micdadei]CEG62101.1 Cation efflux system protein [Legionella micdadei]
MIYHEYEDKEHAHSHTHSHNHHHGPAQFNRAFLIAIIANGFFVVFQIIYAYIANSTSLLADAIHNLGDVLSLILAWIANNLLNRMPTHRTTYGMKKTSILAALANGILLVFTCGIIASEAVYKLFSPSEVQAVSVMVVATLGIVINGATAALFLRGSDDLNIRAAFLHLLYDAIISVGVVVSAALLYWTHWLWIDPVVGLLIAFLIIKGTWSLFADSFRLIIDAVPRSISWNEVREFLQAEPGVKEVHDLHIWAMSTQENALSVHLYMPDTPLSDEARQSLVRLLREKHNIHHATIQVERNLTFCDDACTPMLS